MQNTRNIDDLAAALLDLVNFLNSPKRDDALLRAADVELDRALFPLLVRIGMQGTVGVATLADQVGRDHTTVSRQLSKLKSLDLVEQVDSPDDGRRRAVRLKAGGSEIVRAITCARRGVLSAALANWSDADRSALTDLTRRFADTLSAFADARKGSRQIADRP